MFGFYGLWLLYCHLSPTVYHITRSRGHCFFLVAGCHLGRLQLLSHDYHFVNHISSHTSSVTSLHCCLSLAQILGSLGPWLLAVGHSRWSPPLWWSLSSTCPYSWLSWELLQLLENRKPSPLMLPTSLLLVSSMEQLCTLTYGPLNMHPGQEISWSQYFIQWWSPC